jgi:hypothetical protein
MKLTHVYRIKPTPEQVAIMDLWLELLETLQLFLGAAARLVA